MKFPRKWEESVKIVDESSELRKREVRMSGLGSLEIQFGKNCEVDAFEEDEGLKYALKKTFGYMK